MANVVLSLTTPNFTLYSPLGDVGSCFGGTTVLLWARTFRCTLILDYSKFFTSEMSRKARAPIVGGYDSIITANSLVTYASMYASFFPTTLLLLSTYERHDGKSDGLLFRVESIF